MSNQQTTGLPGSNRLSAPGVRPGEPVGDEPIEITLIVRRRAELPAELVTGPAHVSRAELAERYGASPDDIAQVEQTVRAAGLGVVATDAGSRRLRVSGPARVLAQMFGATLTNARSTDARGRDVEHRHRTGELRLPAELGGVVTGVLGLDNRPQARAQVRFAAAGSVQQSYTPVQIADAYEFPAGDGTGRTVAIIELGGGFAQSDLDSYFGGLGVGPPTVTAVGVDGVGNQPGADPNGADGEVLLDIDVIGAIAPAASIVVYFGPNTDDGFLDAISTAVHAGPTPVAVSISWGGAEDTWTEQSRAAMDQTFQDAAALGVTVTAAAGDGGSADGQTDGAPHCDFPASSPHALACGGTTLTTSGGQISAETVWNGGAQGGATGGGVSTAFPLPGWQARAGVPDRAGTSTSGRGVPDVAGDADPATGYQVLVDGNQRVIGGTSAVAPLWAGLIARLAQGSGFGLLQPSLYAGVGAGAAAAGFHDITDGSNGAYDAGPGWDPCTGLGSPDGTTLPGLVSGTSAQPSG
ncbi:MAG: S53 family peptidase [Mycobacteriales bacterium]|nr:MAG: peptidase S53 [Pseudonocardiales bacterium]